MCFRRRAVGESSVTAVPEPPPAKRLSLINKPPTWNEQRRCWCLNFRNRVKLESIRNFQLVFDQDRDNIIMQARATHGS